MGHPPPPPPFAKGRRKGGHPPKAARDALFGESPLATTAHQGYDVSCSRFLSAHSWWVSARRCKFQMVTPKSKGRVILCVDDEAIGLTVRKMTLESQGYSVLTAENGPDGLAIFSAEPIDLVVLDYKMPGMNGDIVAERMKRLKPSVPILMLSAYVDLPRETLALVDMYMTKGEGPLNMLESIARLLEQIRPFSKATSVK